MSPDEAADVLAEMEEASSEAILEEMEAAEKTDVEELLEFDEHRGEAGLVTRLEAFADEIDEHLGARIAVDVERPGLGRHAGLQLAAVRVALLRHVVERQLPRRHAAPEHHRCDHGDCLAERGDRRGAVDECLRNLLNCLCAGFCGRLEFVSELDRGKRICRALAMLKDKKLENPWRKHGNIPL